MWSKFKHIYNNNNEIICFAISILCTIAINIELYVVDNKISCNGNKIIWIMIFALIYIILKKSYIYKERRLIICSYTLGVTLGIFQVLGIMTKDNWIVSEVVITKEVIWFILIKFITYSFLFANISKVGFKYIENIRLKIINKENDLFKPNIKSYIVVAIILLIAWLPYFLNYYPGITSFDTNYQLMQGFGVYEYSNHHPVLHTIIITAIVKIGYAIAGNYNFGIALCSIIQMVLCASTFSFVLYYMSKRNIHHVIKKITFIFFAFCPFIPQFSIAIWKDVPFALCMVLFTICLIEMLINEKTFIEKVQYNIILFSIITLIMFFRNNGVYIILCSLPFVVIFKRKYWKRLFVIFFVPVMIYFIITGPIYVKLNIAKSSSREMLSIPIQQMARIVKYKYDELTVKEKEIIGTYIPIEEVSELYNPTISDPVKNNFSDEEFERDKLNLVKLYVKLALRFPGETIEALVGNTYGYYYPEVTTYSIATGTYIQVFDNEKFMDIHQSPIVKIPLIDKIIDAIYDKQIPIVSLIANIGFAFWVLLTILTFCIYKKNYKLILCYIPIIFLYLTCLASPVSGELRYIYSMFLCLPLFIGFSLKKEEEIDV